VVVSHPRRGFAAHSRETSGEWRSRRRCVVGASKTSGGDAIDDRRSAAGPTDRIERCCGVRISAVLRRRSKRARSPACKPTLGLPVSAGASRRQEWRGAELRSYPKRAVVIGYSASDEYSRLWCCRLCLSHGPVAVFSRRVKAATGTLTVGVEGLRTGYSALDVEAWDVAIQPALGPDGVASYCSTLT